MKTKMFLSTRGQKETANNRFASAINRLALALAYALLFGLQTPPSLAQPHYSPDWTASAATARQDSSQGWWQLKTLADTRHTQVRFFDTQGQLIYQENLPGQWVKLNRRTQAQFDQLLAQLVSGRLVKSRVKTDPLPYATPQPAPRHATAETEPSTTSSASKVNAFVSKEGKLYLAVNNPERVRYTIKMMDNTNRLLYFEYTNHSKYLRKFDITGLYGDTYRVTIQIGDKKHTYYLDREDPKPRWSVSDPEQRDAAPMTVQLR